ncbi:p100K [Bottlenose dolphin adenovirus 1]|uniref:Shutoff protein n=1 Tax=Bottlenose dolphin adenovirus 1 TaxID=1714377 RepID=A0A1X7MMK8_9ADEN|nr:p100K [Bottlenose dolphin adenovirus 1]SMG83452.1 p100K [Bottlenose dolphin adenovirus 1]
MEEHNDQGSAPAAAPPSSPTQESGVVLPLEHETPDQEYIQEDTLHKHLMRQSLIVRQAIESDHDVTNVNMLSRKFEELLFSPAIPPKKMANGTCEPNPKLNFYPTFMLPETLATYHIFFNNTRIPFSCRANRTRTDKELMLSNGHLLPGIPTTASVCKIFDCLGDEEPVSVKALEENDNSVLVEMKNDNPRIAVVKRSISVSHFAYPAINLPPKVMSAVMEQLIITKVKEKSEGDNEDGGKPVVSDEEICKWLKLKPGDPEIEERRKIMTAVTLVTAQLQCLKRFFTTTQMIKKIDETLHYMFHHGYVKLASKISNIDLTNLVSYMGILHENRLGQSVLHNSLQGEARRDYIRDTVFLFLIYTWQTAMGVWQQCLEPTNVKELEKLLKQKKKNFWCGFDEKTIAEELSILIFPEKLVSTLREGLPDFTSQSMMQNFRSFILERSGILPATCNAFPSDFVPINYTECPPPLWPYCYLLQLANFFMFHSDVAFDYTGEGILDCYCRCNLCNPHRCLVTNTALLNEIQAINTFELQGPPDKDGNFPPSFKLTPGLWTSAFLRKFVKEDFHENEISFYEDQSKPPNCEPTACVITQAAILAQLQDIKKSREEFLLKKGHGIYLDPTTGEELNSTYASTAHNTFRKSHTDRKSAGNDFSGNGKHKPWGVLRGSFREQRTGRHRGGRGGHNGSVRNYISSSPTRKTEEEN